MAATARSPAPAGSPAAATRIAAARPRAGMLRHVMVMLGGTAAAQLVTLALVPLITRLYSPEMFGSLGVLLGVVAICQVPALAGFHRAIPVADSPRQVRALIVLSAGSTAVTTALVTVVVIGLLGVAPWLGSELRPLLPYVPLAVAAASVYELATFAAVRRRAYRPLSLSKFTHAGVGSSLQLGLGWLACGPAGLVLGEVLGRIVACLPLVLPRQHAGVSAPRRTPLGATARRYRRFVVCGAPAQLMNQAGLYLPTLLLAMIGGVDVAGAFYMAQRCLQLPLALIGRSVSRVLLGEAAQLWREAPEQLRPLLLQTSRKLLLVAAPPLAATLFFGPTLFEVILGARWQLAGLFAQIFAIAALANFAAAPTMQILTVTNREDRLLVWGLLRVALTAAAIVVPYLAGQPAWVSVAALAVATVAIYLVGFRWVLEAAARPPANRRAPATAATARWAA
jgi:O-antigen/teichoic acid export membrane protein